MELENSTEQIAQSGEQTGVVAPSDNGTQESSDTGSRARAVASQRNADFKLVNTDSGEEKTGEAGDGNAAGPEGQGGKADGADAPEPGGADRAGAQTEERSGTHQQSREENAAIRAARIRAARDAEASARARAAEQTDAEIAESGVLNPYTGKPFQSLKEFREYGKKVREAELAKQSKETGRSVAELTEEAENRAFISALRRAAEAGSKRAEEPGHGTRDEQDFVVRDVADFIARYPEFNSEEKLDALENNAAFRRFCGSRFGREPLSELYGAYLELVGDAGSAAVARAAGRAAKSTGGGTGGGTVLSPAQKIALDRWNAENPEMAMTAKEFLER